MVAGSVYAVAPRQRVATARALAAAGLDVHFDLVADGEGPRPGVSLDELRDIAAVVEPDRLGVRVIGTAEFVDAVLPAVLSVRPAKVFLPWHAFTEDRAEAVRGSGGAAWVALWNEWDGIGAPEWPARPDGALVVLIEPGAPGLCLLGRLGVTTACAAELPVIVDGGITEELAPLCITAGAQSLVVGHALLASMNGDRP
ncbi:ribulose phosphate epimerase [Mycolicibacterium sp. CH28]|nr:ribulose phosphate epimerase [Mycolicibacterium sp. CH28]